MKEVLVVQHTPIETLGTIAEALPSRGFGFRYVRTFADEPVPPALDDKAGLILMGGPMGVYEQERYPFLRDEIRLIASALTLERPILGVCLGSQLLAAALGAEVKKGKQKELGWHEVTLFPTAADDPLFSGVPAKFCPFHWHGDVFSLPNQAVALAASEWTNYQAFRYGKNAYGLLFHLEVTAPQISQMLTEFADELREAGGQATEVTNQVPQRLPALAAIAEQVFGRWAAGLEEATN